MMMMMKRSEGEDGWMQTGASKYSTLRLHHDGPVISNGNMVYPICLNYSQIR